MMPYVEYSYYNETYGGVLSSSEFNKVAKKASRLIDDKTYDRAAKAFEGDMKEKISLCCCELCDILNTYEKYYSGSQGGAITTDSNDGYSVTFAAAQNVKRDFNTQINAVLNRYLTRPKNLLLGWI